MSTSEKIPATRPKDILLWRTMTRFMNLQRRPANGPVTVEEMLVHLLDSGDGVRLVAELGGDIEALQSESALLLLDQFGAPASACGPQDASLTPRWTGLLDDVLRRAAAKAAARAKDGENIKIEMLDLLESIAWLPTEISPAAHLLNEHGISGRRLAALSHKRKSGTTLAGCVRMRRVLAVEAKACAEAAQAVVLQLPGWLHVPKWQGKWVDRSDDLVGDALIQANGRGCAGLAIMGEDGSGRESLCAHIAWQLEAQATVDPTKSTQRVLCLDPVALVAGAALHGDVEQRLAATWRLLEERDTRVLQLGSIGALLNAGRGAVDIVGGLRSMLRRRDVKLMAYGTSAQVEQLTEQGRDGWSVVRMPPVSMQTAVAVARIQITGLAKHHGVTYPVTAAGAACELAWAHLGANLDSVVALLDRAGSAASLRGVKRVSDGDLRHGCAIMAGLPTDAVNLRGAARIKRIRTHLEANVVGQGEAIDLICGALERTMAGLGEARGRRPLGAFFLAGPTGVGKTELARQLAVAMEAPLVRLDMSEYREAHTVSRLIGAPPGYVGHRQGGVLTQALEHQPRCVILADEFEKAAPEVHSLFLQILDHGQLTDGQGRHIDFRHCMVLFTSNIGASEAMAAGCGLTINPERGNNEREVAMTSAFTPELRNRFDAIIQFKPLDHKAMIAVADLAIARLHEAAGKSGHKVEFDPGVARWLAKAGTDTQMGARPLARLLDQEVAGPLAKSILEEAKPMRLYVVRRAGRIRIVRQAGRV